MIDPDSFRQFEHSGWQKIPQQYHQAFGELTTQSIEPLLDAAAVKTGTKLVDIATGPGYVAAVAARRGATVIGVDFSATMIAEARSRNPDIEFRDGDAEQLPLGNDLFDSAVVNFGILHLGRPDQALTEACRVLRPGGRFVIMGPNIRYLAAEYWDFYDHCLPLSHLSMEEGLVQADYEIVSVIPRFLPYTTRSRLPQHPLLIALYLKIPLAWRLLGKQFLVIGRKPLTPPA